MAGLEPRGFKWIIAGRLAISERIGGYGFQHRRVRREEEIVWLKEHGVNTIVSLLGGNQNALAYETAGLRFLSMDVDPEIEPEEAVAVFQLLEEALEPEVWTEILDADKASAIIDEASSWAEGVCHCRHVKLHLGKRCDYPLDHCLALGTGADYLVRAGIAKRIDRERARDVLAYAREHGNVQMADNVRNRPGFICNCCSCCCEMMEGMRTLPDMARVVSSNFAASSPEEACSGCGRPSTAPPWARWPARSTTTSATA